MMPQAIVCNCNYNGLSIIQELGIHGINCIAMDCQRSIGTYSKYAKYIRCPDPISHEEDFIRFLYDYCSKQNKKPIIFPTNDHWAIALSKYKKKLNEVSIPCVADWEATENLVHKNKFYEIGREKGYLIPKTWNNESKKNVTDENFPLVAKPIIRRTTSNAANKSFISNMDRLRLTLLPTRKEFDEFVRRESSLLDKLVFQEYVRGLSDSMYTVGIYANRNTDILGLFTGHKVRGYPALSGDCIVGERASIPDYVIENTKRIVKELHYCGIAEFEYKKDEVTGNFFLIEVNPRSWSWIGITPASGVNLPLIAYCDLSGEKIEQSESDSEIKTIKYVKVFEDIQNCLFRYKTDYKKWSKTLVEWKNDIKADKLIFAEHNAGDWPILFIAGIKSLLMFIYNSPCYLKIRFKDYL